MSSHAVTYRLFTELGNLITSFSKISRLVVDVGGLSLNFHLSFNKRLMDSRVEINAVTGDDNTAGLILAKLLRTRHLLCHSGWADTRPPLVAASRHPPPSGISCKSGVFHSLSPQPTTPLCFLLHNAGSHWQTGLCPWGSGGGVGKERGRDRKRDGRWP